MNDLNLPMLNKVPIPDNKNIITDIVNKLENIINDLKDKNENENVINQLKNIILEINRIINENNFNLIKNNDNKSVFNLELKCNNIAYNEFKYKYTYKTKIYENGDKYIGEFTNIFIKC